MTQEEIKSRNIALATYMGWIDTGNREDGEIVWWFPAAGHPKGGMSATDNHESVFRTDMRHLMPVVWKLQKDQGYQFVMDCRTCYVLGSVPMRFPMKLVDVGESPAIALWEAVSSLVMELQQKAV